MAKPKGLYANINRRKKLGTSRPKSKSTISPENYANMQAGFPKKDKMYGGKMKEDKMYGGKMKKNYAKGGKLTGLSDQDKRILQSGKSLSDQDMKIILQSGKSLSDQDKKIILNKLKSLQSGNKTGKLDKNKMYGGKMKKNYTYGGGVRPVKV